MNILQKIQNIFIFVRKIPAMTKTKNNTENHFSREQEKPKIEIEVIRHQWLFDIFERPKFLWRAIVFLFAVVVLFFIGLSFVTIAVKHFYPYNTIKTSLYGYTSISDEEKEVIYWLFNAADLWANSGIEVKENDVLTIRASGAMHTAIHHLVEDAEENRLLRDEWTGTEGTKGRNNTRDDLRMKFRIAKNLPENILLMQVIPSRYAHDDETWYNKETVDTAYQKYICGGDGADVYVIGKERQELIVRQDGILHFAVNDIVLSDSVIEEMYCDNVEKIRDLLPESGADDLKKDEWKLLIKNELNASELGKYEKKISALRCRYDDLEDKAYDFGSHPDSTYEKYFPVVNELNYYKEAKFRNAWFVDNLGSFLIVIERKRR